MLLGFISLLLTVFQDRISTICIAQHLTYDWLPCKKEKDDQEGDGGSGHRRLLAAPSDAQGHCQLEVLEKGIQMHIFMIIGMD